MMREPHFQDEWSALATKDPRITIYQEPGFCLAWFAATPPDEQAVLLTQRHEVSGELIGLLVLSWNSNTRTIQHAGAHQTIYDGWIAEPDYSNDFISDCIEIVFEHFQLRDWTWRYLPPGSPTEWAIRDRPECAPWASHISPYPLPRWNLADVKFFKRKANSKRLRNYANRYRKEGVLELKTVSDPAEIELMLSKLNDWVDFRQGAVHQTLPFRSDPTKLAFYRELALNDSTTRMTALMLDERPLAIQIDSVDDKNKSMSLCLHGYDPTEGQRSPGMILLTLLAHELKDSSFKFIDLTPGSKSWKDDFANEWHEGQRVELYSQYRSVAKNAGKRQLFRLAKTFLNQAGIEPSAAKSQAQRLRNGLIHGRETIKELVTGAAGPRIFELDISSSVSTIGPAPRVKQVDVISALLELSDKMLTDEHSLLLFDALKRFEREATCFAHADEISDAPLTHLSWLHVPPLRSVAPPPHIDNGVSPLISNLCDWIDIDIEADAILVVSYEQNLDCDPVTVITPALNAVRAMGRDKLFIATSARHQATVRWLSARATVIPIEGPIVSQDEKLLSQ